MGDQQSCLTFSIGFTLSLKDISNRDTQGARFPTFRGEGALLVYVEKIHHLAVKSEIMVGVPYTGTTSSPAILAPR